MFKEALKTGLKRAGEDKEIKQEGIKKHCILRAFLWRKRSQSHALEGLVLIEGFPKSAKLHA